MVGRECNALDHICHSFHHVVARHGHVVHAGRLHSHTTGISVGCCCYSPDYRPPAVVRYDDSMKSGMTWGGYPLSSVACMIRLRAARACSSNSRLMLRNFDEHLTKPARE